MARRILKEHFQELSRKLKRDYRLSSEHFGSRALHDLRVDIKRVRAFSNLAEFVISGKNSVKSLQPLERLFKRAGKVRHFQLGMEITKRHLEDMGLRLDWYYNLLKAEELFHRNRLVRFCSDFDLDFIDRYGKKLEKRLSSVSRKEIPARVSEHYYRLLENLKNTEISVSSEVTDFHAVRILAKESRYVSEILRKFQASGGAFDEMEKHLLGLGQSLGAWHDLDLAVIDFDHFGLQLVGDTELCRDSPGRFSSALTTERDLQLELFRSRWIDFMALQPSESPVSPSSL